MRGDDGRAQTFRRLAIAVGGPDGVEGLSIIDASGRDLDLACDTVSAGPASRKTDFPQD